MMRKIKLGPTAEIMLAALPKKELDQVKAVLALLRHPPSGREEKLIVHRLRPGSSQFIVRINDRYRLLYHLVSQEIVKIDDILRVDGLRKLEG